jgi:probable F420-dependent oxidoreductase
MMELGAIFPQTEIGSDPTAIRDYARRVEEMGFARIVAYDHVLGAGRDSRPDWRGPYDSETPFHEPFALFSFLAAITRSIELMSGVIILPQRQTALVAKQAAEVAVLCGGRFVLGVGVGWNPIEFEGLNESFTDRGARAEEQIAVMRALWAAPAITFHGRWHTINDAGINPRPASGTIPIWFGGSVDATLRRVARLGDGWLPQSSPNDRSRQMVERLRAYTREAGRDESAVRIQARLELTRASEDHWPAFALGWRALGATRLDINTMGLGFTSIHQHLEMLGRVKGAVERALAS